MLVFEIIALFVLGLFALAAGTAVSLLADKRESGRFFYKISAFFVMIGAVTTMACTGYHAYRYAEAGYFEIRPADSVGNAQEEGASEDTEGAEGAPETSGGHGGKKGGMECGMMKGGKKCPCMEKMKGMDDEGGEGAGGHQH